MQSETPGKTSGTSSETTDPTQQEQSSSEPSQRTWASVQKPEESETTEPETTSTPASTSTTTADDDENIYPGGVSPQQRAVLAATYPQKQTPASTEGDEGTQQASQTTSQPATTPPSTSSSTQPSTTPPPSPVHQSLEQLRQSPTQTARASNLKSLLQTHAENTPDDGRVKQDPTTGLFKGSYFSDDDPLHQAALSSVPLQQKSTLYRAQKAIANNEPMHISYGAAPAGAAIVPSRASREAEYEESPSQQRPQTQQQVSGHSFLPTAVGLTFGKKKGDPNKGFVQGISASALASNAQHLNDALGESSPYQKLDAPKFGADLAGYIRNVNNGFHGDGSGPATGTTDVPIKPTANYDGYPLSEHEANFLNATFHNVGAQGKGETGRIARALKAAQGHAVTEEGETNPLRAQINQWEGAKRTYYPGQPEGQEPRKPWTEEMMEPTIRHFAGDLIREIHHDPKEMAEELRPPPGTSRIEKVFAKEGIPKKEMVAAHVMPVKRPEPPAVEGGGPPGPAEKIPKLGIAQRLLPAEQPPGPAELTQKKPKTAKPEPAMPTVSKEIIQRIGERPQDQEQAAIYDRIATRMGKGKEFESGVPLVPLRNKKGEFRTDSLGNPLYEQHDYDLTASPLLKKKALAHDQDAPENTKDILGDEFKFLNPTERLRLSHLVKNGAVDTFAKSLGEEYQKHSDVPEVMAGKGWYSGVRDELKKHLGAHSDLFANLLAATSPRMGVVDNWKNAYEAYDKFRRGDFDRNIRLYRQAYQMRDRGELLQHMLDSGISQGLVDKGISKKLPTTEAAAMADWMTHHDITPRKDNGKLFGMHSEQVLKVLASTWEKELKGPKTANFSGNLGGKTLQATIDMWAARTMRRLGYEGQKKEPWVLHPPQEQAVHNLDFAFSQLAFRKAAEAHGLTPDDLQAILWYTEQRHWNKQGWSKDDVSKKDYRPLLGTLKELPHKPATEPHEWEPEPLTG